MLFFSFCTAFLLPEDSSYDRIEEVFLFCPIQCIASSLHSENDQIIASHGEVPFSVIDGVCLIHEELCVRIGPAILACPAPIGLQTATNLVVLLETSS